MTLEELKAEAKKHGYKLTKEYPYIRLAPCICGSKNRTLWYDYVEHKHFYGCNKCDFRTDGARTKHEAKLKWNECVERVKALEYITSDIDTMIDAREELK